MDIKKYEVFLRTIESGNITQTANLLGYTQPGITRIIHSLEEEIGMPLLLRTSNGVQPTENAKQLIPIMKEIVRLQAVMTDTVSEINGLMRGSIVIGCYYSVSSQLLPPILKQFQDNYPHIQVQIQEGTNKEIKKWLEEGSIDFSFAEEYTDLISTNFIPLIKDEEMVWVSEENPLSQCSSIPLQALNNQPFIRTFPDYDTDIDRLIYRTAN